MADPGSSDRGAPTQMVVVGDSRRLRRVADDSVHLVVTSPPYWQLKDYGGDGQIGFHQTYEQYLDALNAVWDECIRVVHPGCRIAVNIGDQFTRAAVYGRYKVLPIREAIVRHMEARGADSMGAIIWQKVTTCNTSGGGAVMGSFPFPRNGVVKIDYEFILLFKKPGKAPVPDREAKEAARLTTEEWNTYFYGHWNFPGERQADHIAAFPRELPRRLIRMFTFPGETVLDPFLGSGTTLEVAAELGRRGIGYEINAEFVQVIRRRLGFEGQLDLLAPDIELEIHDDRELDVAAAAESAGSSAADGEAFDRVDRRDPGGYGSVIRRGDRRGREEYRRVKEVRDIHTVLLDGGEEIRLLGVTANERSEADGIERLRALVKGTPVYLRDDSGTTDGGDDGVTDDRARHVYLYLKNRTFVNARLIREGLAQPDRTRAYRHRKRFERYAEES